MDSLWALKDLLCQQADEIVKKGDISPTELDRVYKLVDVIKDIVTIDAMEHPDDYSFDSDPYDGQSMAMSRNSYRRSYDGRRGRDGDADGRYSERRYSSRRMYRDNGMSRHDEKEYLMQEMEELRRQIEQMK